MAATDQEVPKGQRFTHIYADRGKPTQDSERMRRRLTSLIDDFPAFHTDFPERLSQRAETELGIEGPWTTNRSWRYFLEKWDLKDVLDLVTIGYRLSIEHTQNNPYKSA